MVGHLVIEAEAAEPPVGQVEMDVLAQPTLGPDPHHVADDQHPDDQLGIDRGPARVAVERPKPRPHPVHVEEAVDLPKQVVGGHVALQIELVEELRLGLLNAHHRPILPISPNRVNQGTCRTATRSFSTPSAVTFSAQAFAAIEVESSGQAEMLAALALACSLGPAGVLVDRVI
jgi:hypothetical protein